MSHTPTKPRIDAWDAPLTEEQRWQAYAKLRRSTWYEAAQWVSEEFGIPAPSRAAIYRWAKRMRQQESTRRLEQAVQARAEIGALAGAAANRDKMIGGWLAMATELGLQGSKEDAVRLTNMAMQLAAQQTAQAELELKQQRLKQQADAQRLAREKFEAAEARLGEIKTAVVDTKLTEEERTARIREIFGL